MGLNSKLFHYTYHLENGHITYGTHKENRNLYFPRHQVLVFGIVVISTHFETLAPKRLPSGNLPKNIYSPNNLHGHQHFSRNLQQERSWRDPKTWVSNSSIPYGKGSGGIFRIQPLVFWRKCSFLVEIIPTNQIIISAWSSGYWVLQLLPAGLWCNSLTKNRYTPEVLAIRPWKPGCLQVRLSDLFPIGISGHKFQGLLGPNSWDLVS